MSRAFAEAMAATDEDRPRPTPAAAFNRARERFNAGVKLDMAALAADLGVGRTTLYRWTGDRDRLLSDICVANLEELIRALDAAVKGRGAERLEEIVARLLSALSGSEAFRSFLRQEGEHGFLLVTAAEGRVRRHLVAALTEAIEREHVEHGYAPPAPAGVLADGVVAISERFLYHNGNAAMNPDPATARVVVRLLLREA